MSNVARATQTLRKVLAELGWNPTLDSVSRGFSVDLGPPHVPIASVYAAISMTGEQLLVYFNFGMVAPVELRDECARLITRANWGLTIGTFEMDYSDGQVRFKSSLDFTGSELTEEMIRNAIRPAMNAVDAYAEAVLDVVTGKKRAVEAIAETGIDSNGISKQGRER